jgi:hypothetical protein
LKKKKFIHTNGFQTRDLAACSTVPQPTAIPVGTNGDNKNQMTEKFYQTTRLQLREDSYLHSDSYDKVSSLLFI